MFNNGDGTWTGYYSASGNACTNATLQEACGTMSGMHWNAWNQTCEPKEPECTANQVKDSVTGLCKDTCPAGMVVNQNGQCDPEPDTCPAGHIRSPEGACLPGEGQCAAGEAPRQNGTCGRDSDGDGQADEDDDNPDNDPDKPSFSGGDNCDNPPSCSGDVIMCGQARIQWRIECNTRKDRKITGGACGAVPLCVGKNCDALEYSSLLMQWRTTCAIEKLSITGGVGGGGETGIKAHMTAMKQAEVDGLRGLGTNDGHGDVDADGIFHTFDNSSFNPNLFGGAPGGQCPTSWNIKGKHIELPAGWWGVVGFISWLMVACAYLWIAFKLGS